VIAHLSAALAEFDLIPPGKRLRYFINLTTGEAMSISAFLEGQDRFFQVKVSESAEIELEYSTYRNAWTDFADFVPRPIGYTKRERWHMMVSEGIRHTPLPLRMISAFDDAAPEGPIADLLRFFAAGRERMRSDADSHRALFDLVAKHFALTPIAALSQHWLERCARQGAFDLPVVAQHGDFVLNNLALSGTSLIVFDWEDYGRTTLQGLDLATLAISVWGYHPTVIRDLSDPKASLPPPMEAFLRRACSQCGVEFDLFRLQLPLYVLVFLYLKRNYGSGLKERLSNLLQHMSANERASNQP
jgi:hypothetical protein